MTDIQKRLVEQAKQFQKPVLLLREAANEIEKLRAQIKELEPSAPPPPAPAIITSTMEDMEYGAVVPSSGLHHKRIFVTDRPGIVCERDQEVHIAECEFVFAPHKGGVRGIDLKGPGNVRIENIKSVQPIPESQPYAPYKDNHHIKIEGARQIGIAGFDLKGGTKGIEIRASEGRPLEEWLITKGHIENTRDIFGPGRPIEGHCIQVSSTHEDRDPPWLGTDNVPAHKGSVVDVHCRRDATRFAGADDMNFYHCGRVDVTDCTFDGQNHTSAAFVQFERCTQGLLERCEGKRAHQTGFSGGGTKRLTFGHLKVYDRFDQKVVLDQEASGLPKLPAYAAFSYRGFDVEELIQSGPLYADAGEFLMDAFTPGHSLAVTRV